MSDDELDKFFIDTLKAILEDVKDCAAYVEHLESPEYKEIKEDYEYVIQDIQGLLETVKTIDDLAEMDEEEIDNVFEYLESYYNNFIIRSDEEGKKEDIGEVEKLEELIDLFFDDEEE